MAMTPQTQAIGVANQLIGLAAQLLAIYQQMVIIDAAWADGSMANLINALATASLNADGSIGAVDGTPNTAHPITNLALQRSMSATQITQLKTVLDNIVTYVNGGAVSATASARGILNSASGS
jgi:hypothetical protein